MKKRLIILITVMMICIFGMAAAEEFSAVGKPFPDFQTMDTERNVFSLSEELKSHEAVLINLWASWCGPCVREFPFLNEVYSQYKDKVAFIGLTVEPDDTWEILKSMKAEYGIEYPVAREAGTSILQHIGGNQGTPTTIIVDRFGNAVYMQVGSFSNSSELSRALDAFLGDSYTESKAITKIPLPKATQALPVSAARSMRVENEDARRIVLHARYTDPEYDAYFGEETVYGYVVPGETARIVMEIAPGDDLTDIVYSDFVKYESFDMFSLLDKERNAYVYEQRVGDEERAYAQVSLGTKTGNLDADPAFAALFLFRDEKTIQKMVDDYREDGMIITWEYTEESKPETAEKTSYAIYVIDQNGDPVPGVMVNFCNDQACTMAAGDEKGVISFDGAPEDYHIQVLKVPEGYSVDPAFEMQTGNRNEFVLIVEKK